MKSAIGKGTMYRVQAVDRALDILDSFTFQNRELGLSEVAMLTGLNKTTAKRLISNLTARGYLQQDANSKRYHLGMRLFELGGIVFSSFSLREAAAGPMTRLQNETGATVHFNANGTRIIQGNRRHTAHTDTHGNPYRKWGKDEADLAI